MQIHFRYPVFTLSLFLALHTFAYAQGEKKNTSNWPVITLRTNPLSVLEADANFMLGAGIQWHPRWAVTIEPAYIFFRLYDTEQGEGNLKDRAAGFKLRADLRYYFNDFVVGKKAVFFIAPEFHYKYVVYRKWEDFGINCVNGQCDFFQLAQYKEIKNETGGLLKLGVNMPGFTNWMSCELFGGLGFKFKRIRETDIPAGGSFFNAPSRRSNSLIPPEGLQIMLPAGVKFCFLIGS